MTRWQVYLVLALGIFGLGFVTALGISAHRASTKAQAAQAQADQHEGASQIHATQAVASDQQAIQDQATVANSDALAASAKRELDRRLAALHGSAPASHPSPASLRATGAPVGDNSSPTGSLGNLPEIPDSSAQFRAIPGNSGSSGIPDSPIVKDPMTVAALAQAQLVIADQQAQIEARDRLIASLTASRDAWKASAEEAQKALALQKVAMDATVHSEARRGLLRTIETGVITAAVGYVAGRVTK